MSFTYNFVSHTEHKAGEVKDLIRSLKAGARLVRREESSTCVGPVLASREDALGAEAEAGGEGADPVRPPLGHPRGRRQRPRPPPVAPAADGGRRALRGAGPARHRGEQGRLLQPQPGARGEGVRVALAGPPRPQVHRLRQGEAARQGLLGPPRPRPLRRGGLRQRLRLQVPALTTIGVRRRGQGQADGFGEVEI